MGVEIGRLGFDLCEQVADVFTAFAMFLLTEGEFQVVAELIHVLERKASLGAD